MSRAQTQTLNMTNQQLDSINAQNQQFLNQQQQLGNTISSQYQNILNNPGLSPAQQAAVTAQSQGSIASAFGSLQQSAANRVAATNNSAGFSELTTSSHARRPSRKGIRRSRTSSPSQTRLINSKCPPCRVFPAFTAWTPTYLARLSAFLRSS